MHRNQLKAKIFNFNVILDKIRKRLVVSPIYITSRVEHVFLDRPYLSQDQFRINVISTTTMTRADKFKTATNIVPRISQITIDHTFHE